MEIQSQSVIAGGTGAATGNSGTASNAASNGTQAPFATTLNGMMSGNSSNSGATAAGIQNAQTAVQLLNPLLASLLASNEAAFDGSAESIGALAELLQQPEQADALLSNPDLQAWFMQLQALITSNGSSPSEEENQADAEQAIVGSNEEPDTEAAEEAVESLSLSALDPLLFVPIADNGSDRTDSGDAMEGQKQASLTGGQAVQLLHQLKDWIQSGSHDSETKQLLKQLPVVLASVTAAANMAHIHKSSAAASPVVLNTNQAKSVADQNNADAMTDLGQIVSIRPKHLEMLANKHVPVTSRLESASDDEKPLFEPLVSQDANETAAQPITVQEFMRQTQNGHSVKMPVLHMPASTFTDDMTQFVVSSFVMEASADGFTEAKISLYPQHLGHVDVKLTMHNGQLVAQFVADSLVGKEMLENQLSQLRTALQSHGIQVEKLEVSQSQSFQSGMFQDGRQQQQPGQSAKQQKSSGGRAEAVDEVSAEESGDAAVSVRSANNGSIDITA